jgi:lipoprotein-releasing system ATP-binding protein
VSGVGPGEDDTVAAAGRPDEPTAGEVRVAGESMTRASDVDRGRLRNRALGFVYQFIICFL